MPGIVKEHELASAFIPGITIEEVNQLASDLMRESHSLGFCTVVGRDYLAVDYHGGLVEVGPVGLRG